MTHQISHKIETYQLEGLIEDGTIAHHTINILSKGVVILRWRSSRVVKKSMVRGEERMRERQQRKHPT